MNAQRIISQHISCFSVLSESRTSTAMLMLIYHLFIQEEHNFDYHLRMLHDKLKVKQIMSDELVCLPPAVKLSELAHILRSTTHGAFPVTTDAVGMGTNRDGIDLEGVVTRIQLLRMVQNRVGFVKVVSSVASAQLLLSLIPSTAFDINQNTILHS